MDDTELVASCRAGLTGAFEALIAKYQTPLLTMTWHVLGNQEDARDAAQGAFLSAFSKLETFDSRKDFKTWLFSIAWKDCLDLKRKHKIRRLFLQNRPLAAIPASPQEPSAVRLEDSETFGPLLLKLKPRERLVLSLRINENCTAAEIAGILGCAESSARVYFFKALRKMREFYDKEK